MTSSCQTNNDIHIGDDKSNWELKTLPWGFETISSIRLRMLQEQNFTPVVSRPRPRPAVGKLKCTRDPRPWSQDHNTAYMCDPWSYTDRTIQYEMTIARPSVSRCVSRWRPLWLYGYFRSLHKASTWIVWVRVTGLNSYDSVIVSRHLHDVLRLQRPLHAPVGTFQNAVYIYECFTLLWWG